MHMLFQLLIMSERHAFIKDGEALKAIVSLYDVDGTVNDQGPEAQRLDTIGPGKQALSRLHALGIETGPISSRSTGEALLYAQHLNSRGIMVSEDGGVIILPTAHMMEGIRNRVRSAIETTTNRSLILMSATRLEDIQAMLDDVQSQVPTEPLISTLTSTPSQLQEVAGHGSQDMAQKSAERFASAYVVPTSAMQRDVLLQKSEAAGIRAFGNPVNLIGPDVNKGKALRFLHDNAADIYGDARVKGIFPILFGNDVNDIPGFAFAQEIGGIGVMVAKPDGEFRVDVKDIPEGTLLRREPYGYGMKAAVDVIVQQLSTRYALRIL